MDNLSFKTTTSAYRYDSVGNRTYDAETTRYTVADEGDIIESTYHYNSYNKLNQLTAVSEVCAKTANNNSSSKTYVTRYKYDARGNKKEEVDGKSGDITTYAYDVENQLVDVKVNNKLVQHNEYNGAGQRIKKVEKINSESGDKTETTNYFYEGTLLLYTTDEDGEKTSQNIIGNASNTFATIRYEKEQKEYFYSKDIQGSTTNISDREGNCVGSYDYTDFGETSERIASTVANEICYTGGVYDKTTELYYLNARYYDPEDGVFMSQDTYRGTDTDVASWNLYGYCEGNPVNYVDPSGHIIETVIDVGSILYSGYEMINKPSFINFGFLAWDVGATFLPFVPGSYVGRGVKASLKAISRHKRTYKMCKGINGIKYIKKAKKAKLVLRAAESISDLNKASSISVGKYKHLKKAYKGVKNVEVHHIIEKRLSSGFKKGIKKSDIMSIPLDKKLHRKFTNRWRKVVPYGKSGKHISKKKMISYCRQVYHDTPKLRKIATHYVENNWR